jgi:hypothetical protein
MKYRLASKTFLFFLFVIAPIFGCYRYYTQLQILTEDFRPLYAYWLLPKWSPVLYASNMYLWGSILGLILGIYVWRAGKHTISGHLKQIVALLKLTLQCVITGILIWFLFDIWYSGIRNINVQGFVDLVRDCLAFLAVYQYILIWGVMSYGLCVAFQRRILPFVMLFALQVYELFWGIHHLQRFELVLPTAISRVPIALAYPVWKKDSWAADYPSLLASTPMTFTSKYQILDVGLLWILVVESIYVLLIGCIIYLNSSKEETKQCNGIPS